MNPLPLSIRVTLLILGWLLLFVGVAGLFLPGLQGVLTLLLGAALLSLASEWVYKRLRAVLHRWPNLWAKVQEFRHWAHDKLSPNEEEKGAGDGEEADEESGAARDATDAASKGDEKAGGQ